MKVGARRCNPTGIPTFTGIPTQLEAESMLAPPSSFRPVALPYCPPTSKSTRYRNKCTIPTPQIILSTRIHPLYSLNQAIKSPKPQAKLIDRGNTTHIQSSPFPTSTLTDARTTYPPPHAIKPTHRKKLHALKNQFMNPQNSAAVKQTLYTRTFIHTSNQSITKIKS